MPQLFSTPLEGQDIRTPIPVATWVADIDYDELLMRILLSGLVGGGIYQTCATVQPLEAGPIYQSPTSFGYCAAGVTTLWLPSLIFPVEQGDALNVYVQGLAGDQSVGVITTLWYNAGGGGGIRTARLLMSKRSHG